MAKTKKDQSVELIPQCVESFLHSEKTLVGDEKLGIQKFSQKSENISRFSSIKKILSQKKSKKPCMLRKHKKV